MVNLLTFEAKTTDLVRAVTFALIQGPSPSNCTRIWPKTSA